MNCSSRRLPSLASFASLALLALSACTGLGSEPRIVSTLAPPTATLVERTFPVSAPDMALGAAVYAQYCTQCHGVTGAGDGPLVQSGQVVNAKNFRLPETARGQRPSDYYAIITNGRIERLMPPWRDALTEDERWAAALYTYTLHYQAADLERGRELYAAQCAECHGPNGAGDAERAAESDVPPSSLLDQEAMALLSDQVIYTIVTEGQRQEMPAYADILSDAERWQVTAFTRSLSLASPQRIAQQAPATPTPALTAQSGTVRGQIVNGTAGASVPPDLPVTLFFYDEELRESTLTANADANGAFVFEDVPMSAAFQYAAIATYDDRSYFNPPVPGSDGGTLNVQVTIYERTEDPAALVINGMVAQVSAVGASLEVTQLFTLRNGTDRAFSTSQATVDSRPVSVTLPLPPGAVVLGFPNGESRFVVSADGSAIQDTVPVLPNSEHIVAVVYIIPYEGSAIIEQPLPYAVAGAVRVLVRPDSVQLSSDQLPATGAETIGETTWQGYGGALSLTAGTVLRYSLAGAAAEVEGSAPGVVSSNNLLPILVFGILAEIVLVIGLYLWWRRRRQRAAAPAPAASAADPTLMDGLIRQIAELDAQAERGEIDADSYQRQRGLLKARLTALMEAKS